MPAANAIIEYLNTLEDPAVDQAVAAALSSADDQSLTKLANMLLLRGDPRGLLAIVLQFHRFDNHLQSQIVAQADRFYSSLREAARRRSETTHLNIIEVVRRARDARLTYLLADELKHAQPTVCAAAADALLELSKWAASDSVTAGETFYDAQAAHYLQKAIEEGLRAYGHHEQENLLLAFAQLTPRPTPTGVSILSDERNAATSAMQQLAETSEEPAVIRSLLIYLRIAPLTSSAIAGLRNAVSLSRFASALDNGHLLAIEDVRSALDGYPSPRSLLPQPGAYDSYKPYQLRFLPAWIDALPLRTGDKLEQYLALRSCSDAATRLAAVRRLIELKDEYVQAEHARKVALFCEDDDPYVARYALRYVMRTKWDGLTPLLLKLINSPHEQVARLASQRVSPVGFEKLWSSWPRLGYGRQLAAGRAMIKIDPNFHVHLGEKLASLEMSEKLRALSIIRTLNQGEFFLDSLQALSKSDDEVMASAAVRALGAVVSKESVDHLEIALKHRDARVRANAIEALEQMQSTRHVNDLIDIAKQDENRPRANAIGSLMNMRMNDALALLGQMLNDQRPMHRVSGLWLVNHLGLAEMARNVADLAVGDGDPDVKLRAEKVISHLIEALHSSGFDAGELPDAAQMGADPVSMTPETTSKTVSDTVLGAASERGGGRDV